MSLQKRITVILLTAAVMLGTLAPASYAKDMEECYLCGTTGRYNCRECGNKGEVVCDGCEGKGRFECPGEEGKGKCDNGYYVCPSCNGDGLSRPIPADGKADPCGQCGGSGKLECWHCHGAGIIVCDRCGGEGKTECQNENCKEAKKIDYKCPRCKGTGFTGDGQDFSPEWNDGIHNVPEIGDHIITDHTTWTGYYYGTGKTDKDIQQEHGDDENNEKRDPATGRDYIWFVDVGSGVFEVEGQSIVIKRQGEPVSGRLDLKYDDPFEISGITKNHVHIYITGENGYRSELGFLNGEHEVSIGSRLQKSTKAPFELTLVIEYDKDDGQPDDVPGPGGDEHQTRRVDFGDGSWSVEGADKPVTAWIDGKQATGVIEMEFFTVIKTEGFDQDKMTARIYADDGFSVHLSPSGDNEFNIGRYDEQDCVLADDVLHFTVEAVRTDPPVETEGETKQTPNDRNSDYDIIPPENDAAASACIEIGRMTEEEQKRYAAMEENELAEVIETVKKIVETAQPGTAAGATDMMLDQLAKNNGFESVKDGRLFPITFDGHIDVGFPVKVTVALKEGELDGGKDIYVYHQLQTGKAELLGKAEYTTYDDGSIETLSFFTSGFSTFFTAAKELDLGILDPEHMPASPESTTSPAGEDTPTKETEKKAALTVVIIVCVCAAAAVAAVAVVLIVKKRKK